MKAWTVALLLRLFIGFSSNEAIHADESQIDDYFTGLIETPEESAVIGPEEQAYLDGIYTIFGNQSFPLEFDARIEGRLSAVK